MRLLKTLTATLGRKIGLAIAICIIVSAWEGWASYTGTQALLEHENLVRHTWQVIDNVETVSESLKDAERYHLRYLVNENPTALTRVDEARVAVETAWETAYHLTSDNPAQQRRLENLRNLTDDRFELIHRMVAKQQNAAVQASLQEEAALLDDMLLDDGLLETVEAVSYDAGLAEAQLIMADIYEVLNELEDTERHLLDERADVAEETAAAMMTWLGVMSSIMMLVLFGVGYMLTRTVSRPVRALAEASAAVAEGDFTRQVDIRSNDELGHLGTAFNDMVTRIESSAALAQKNGEAAEEAARTAEEARLKAEEERLYLDHSIDEMLNIIERFAEGDLTVALHAQRDDKIAELYNGFNRAVDEIRGMLNEVNEAVSSAAGAATEISASTEQLAGASQEQSVQATEVAAAVEQMVRTIVENSSHTSRAAQVTEEFGDVAREGGEVVNQTVTKIRRIAEVVRASTDTVSQLGASSEQIGAIVSVIDEIADQTNLLALNAAIEAARAGDQGRGFAVVADEVRKLAERTSDATQEIATMIKTIQAETRAAVEAMNAGDAEVAAGIELADRAGDSLKRVVEGSRTTVDMITMVAAASEEQSVTSEQIARSVEMISNVSGESAQGISQIAGAADDLNRITSDLDDKIRRFRIKSDARSARSQTNGARVPVMA